MRKPHQLKKQIIFQDKDDIRWFQDNYPSMSLSLFCSLALKFFRELDADTPLENISMTAKEMRRVVAE